MLELVSLLDRFLLTIYHKLDGSAIRCGWLSWLCLGPPYSFGGVGCVGCVIFGGPFDRLFFLVATPLRTEMVMNLGWWLSGAAGEGRKRRSGKVRLLHPKYKWRKAIR